MATTLTQRRLNPFLVIAIGVFAVSTAAIFIRLAQEEDVSSLVIAAGRLVVATIVLTPLTLRYYRHELPRLSRFDLLLCFISGAMLAGHFVSFTSSLEYTSVVASVVLVTTYPIFVALLSYPLLGERVAGVVIAGIVIAFIGMVIVAISGDAGDPPTRDAPLLGNGLAIIGAITGAIYFLIGRRIRGKISVTPLYLVGIWFGGVDFVACCGSKR